MPRNIDDIVVPINKKSIRSIPIPENRVSENHVLKPRFTSHPNSPKYSRKFLWIGIGIAAIVLFFAAFSLFSGATVSYTPKSAQLTFNKDTYTAYKSGDKTLLFSVIKLSDDKGVKTPASGEENVSLKASGTIVVYNNAGKNDQKLIKNTRFQSSDGKIFKIPNEIIVPGQKTQNGALVPGSIETTVVAAEAGAEYNIDLSDFTIPGFKGTPQFTTIYARSKTPMTGGFIGARKKVSDSDLAAANTTLNTTLKNGLMDQAKAQVPADFIIFPNLIYIAYSSLPQTNPTDNGVTVNQHADLYGVMFKKTDLANFLASKKLTDDASGPVDVPDLTNLDLSFVGQTAKDLLKVDQLNFQVTGSATAVFLTDENALKNDLVGKNNSDLDSILKKNYPGILDATSVIRPFWKSVFPSDPEKIRIIEKNINK